MIWTSNWLASVVQLFDHTLCALLGEAFFSVLLYFLVFLIVLSLFFSLFRTSRKM